MHGKKLRIYYQNITKLCTNCLRNYQRRQCQNQKVLWVTHVVDFITDSEKWWGIVESEFPGYCGEEITQHTTNEPNQNQQHIDDACCTTRKKRTNASKVCQCTLATMAKLI